MLCLLFIFVTNSIFAAGYSQVENGVSRKKLIEALHDKKMCGPCLPDSLGKNDLCVSDSALLCLKSSESKQMLEDLYPQGGAWDQEDASKCKKCLVTCRRGGCGCEHCCVPSVACGFAAFALACMPVNTLNVLVVSLGTCVTSSWAGIAGYTCTKLHCDPWLSNPQNRPQAKSMSEDDEDEIQREIINDINDAGFLTDSSSDDESLAL